MPYRWLICPVILYTEIDTETSEVIDISRRPKIATITDPGRGKFYQHSSAIDVGNWCLCLVSALDFSPLDSDPEVFDLFQIGGYKMSADIMGKILRQLGLNNPRVNRVRNAMTNRGINTTGLTIDSTVETWLTRICIAISPQFHPRGLFCREV